MKDSTAFKKIQYHSKSPTSQLFDSSTVNYNKFSVLNNLYNNKQDLSNSKDYYTDRQDSYTSLLSTQLGSKSNLESKAVSAYLAYNHGLSLNSDRQESFNSLSSNSVRNSSTDTTRLTALIDNQKLHSTISVTALDNNADSYNLNNTSDGKFHNNALKPLAANTLQRKPAIITSNSNNVDLESSNFANEANEKFSNVESSSKFKDIKSPNMGFLSADKNTRLISKLHTSKGQFNFSNNNSNLADILNSIEPNSATVSEGALYDSSSKD
jgi:hypothetical protein